MAKSRARSCGPVEASFDPTCLKMFLHLTSCPEPHHLFLVWRSVNGAKEPAKRRKAVLRTGGFSQRWLWKVLRLCPAAGRGNPSRLPAAVDYLTSLTRQCHGQPPMLQAAEKEITETRATRARAKHPPVEIEDAVRAVGACRRGTVYHPRGPRRLHRTMMWKRMKRRPRVEMVLMLFLRQESLKQGAYASHSKHEPMIVEVGCL